MRARESLFKLFGLCLLAGVLLAGLMFPVTGGLGLLSNRTSETIENLSTDVLRNQPPLVTTLTDVNGKPIAYLYDHYRVPTAPDEISPTMKDAIIAIEDERFEQHHGVDWKATIRAAITNQATGDVQGASTLTQQYVKNYLINVTYRNDEAGQARAQEQTIARKLREARMAVHLEQQMSKEEILTGYLNVIEFARQVYGVGAAAHAYFGTTPDQLNVPQSALLAGMVNNPSMLDPWSHPKAALERRNLVIDQMVKHNKLAPADGEAAKETGLGVLPEPDKPSRSCLAANPKYGFFCDYVQQYLAEAGIDEDTLRVGGYTIRTTLDPKITNEAKAAAERGVPKTQEGVANTLSIIRPGKKKHEVAALVANRDHGVNEDKGQTTYGLPYEVANPHGAGSVFKTFTAAAALEHGMGIHNEIQTPSHYVSNKFVGGAEHCPNNARGANMYCVGNYSDNYPSSMTLQEALATSPNTGFVALEDKLGMPPVLDMANRLGLRETMTRNGMGETPQPNSDNPQLNQSQQSYFGPTDRNAGKASFTLGPGAVSGLELANVAATIMSGGTWCPPTPVKEITDRYGNPVKIKDRPCEQAVAEPLANTLAVGMGKDHTSGTATGAAGSVNWDRPMIGKTGTTQREWSAAFIGATPQLAGAAMTFADGGAPRGLCGTPPQLCSPSAGDIVGGSTPAHTWFDAMSKILEGQPKKPLPPTDPRYVHGGPTVTVPNVIHKKVGDAKSRLSKAGYQTKVERLDSTEPKDKVIGQTPRGVTGPGRMITLYVSSGQEPEPELVDSETVQPGTPPGATDPPTQPGN